MKTLRRIAKQNQRPMLDAPIVALKEVRCRSNTKAQRLLKPPPLPSRPPTGVTSVQDNRGQIRDLFTPQLRRTTLLLTFIWLGITFFHSYLILSYSHLHII